MLESEPGCPQPGRDQRSRIFASFNGATMLSIPGRSGATCDGVSRRELLRVGGAGLLGVTLSRLLAIESVARAGNIVAGGKVGSFGKAKNFIFVFLQGGPSHIDIWDPKPDTPDGIRGQFKNIPTKIKGVSLTEVMP